MSERTHSTQKVLWLDLGDIRQIVENQEHDNTLVSMRDRLASRGDARDAARATQAVIDGIAQMRKIVQGMGVSLDWVAMLCHALDDRDGSEEAVREFLQMLRQNKPLPAGMQESSL